MSYLTLGSVWKNENYYAIDFFKYHRSVGVDKFIILDREYSELKELTKNMPDVEIIHFPDIPENNHMSAWNKLILLNKGKTKFLALIDADQCLVPVAKNSIKDILKDYEDFASIQINWHSFGSSMKKIREPGSLYERFLLRAKDDCVLNVHTQFICQPDRVLDNCPEPHYVVAMDNEVCVNTKKEQITSNKTVELNPNTPLSFNVPALHDIMYVAHYLSKSEEEAKERRARGRCDIFGVHMPEDKWQREDNICNDVFDDFIFNIWKNIK